MPMTIANAASFDCTRAKAPIERLICSNPALSREDDRLGQAIRQRLATLPPDQRKALLELNRGWLPLRLVYCDQKYNAPVPAADVPATVKCLIAVYQDHIRSLLANCTIDQNNTLDDMAVTDELKTTIPRGFTIVGGFRIYMVSWLVGSTRAYVLPSKSHPMPAVLAAPYKSVAQCTVRAPDGTEWLVNLGSHGLLSYVLASDTVAPIK
jgi:uncharacterized protein YecT (DUF1311 family)